MQEIGVFHEKTATFEKLAENYDAIFIDRRCLKIVVQARDLITAPMLTLVDVSLLFPFEGLVQVGSDENDEDETVRMFRESFEKQQAGTFTEQSRVENLPKLLQFLRCKVRFAISPHHPFSHLS